MEDRQPTGVLLEMVQIEPGAPDAAVGRWQTTSATVPPGARAGFTRSSFYSNLRPEEERFPQKIADFSHLAIHETFSDPAAAWEGTARDDGFEGVRVVNRLMFKRYPRPSQGRVVKENTGILLVLISATERGLAQRLRDWGDFVHLHHIAAAAPEGFTSITPYEHIDHGDPRFMHLYEFDCADPVAAFDAMPEAVCRRWGFDMYGEEFMRWAVCDALDIQYVNVFGRGIRR